MREKKEREHCALNPYSTQIKTMVHWYTELDGKDKRRIQFPKSAQKTIGRIDKVICLFFFELCFIIQEEYERAWYTLYYWVLVSRNKNVNRSEKDLC